MNDELYKLLSSVVPHKSETSEESSEDSDYVESETDDSQSLYEDINTDIEIIKTIIDDKKKIELSNLFEKFSKSISKKKEKCEKKRQLKNYNKFQEIISVQKNEDESVYFKTLSPIQQENIIQQLEKIKGDKNIKPLRLRLLDLNLPIRTKSVILKKMDTLMTLDKCGG